MATVPTVSGSEDAWGPILNSAYRLGINHVAQLTVAITATGATAIYCVPTNTKYIPTQALVRSSVAVCVGMAINIGVSTAVNSFLAARSISTLLGSSVAVIMQPSVALTNPAVTMLSAGTSLFVSVPTAGCVSGTYLTIDAYGPLIT